VTNYYVVTAANEEEADDVLLAGEYDDFLGHDLGPTIEFIGSDDMEVEAEGDNATVPVQHPFKG
jgi:hypothetical protein